MHASNENESNFVMLTGLLVKKDRQANNVDSKRPVLDFDILFHGKNENGEDSICVESIPALLSGGPLARSLPGLNEGEIFEICGYLRNDPNQGLYVEVAKLVKLCDKKNGEPIGLARIRLMEMEMVPNVVILEGTVTQEKYGMLQVKVTRGHFVKGDLRTEDEIPVDALDYERIPKVGETIVCTGQICASSIYADRIYAVIK